MHGNKKHNKQNYIKIKVSDKSQTENHHGVPGGMVLTFPAPITFSAAQTALEQRGQRSELPNFWENLLALEFEEAGRGLELEKNNKHCDDISGHWILTFLPVVTFLWVFDDRWALDRFVFNQLTANMIYVFTIFEYSQFGSPVILLMSEQKSL